MSKFMSYDPWANITTRNGISALIDSGGLGIAGQTNWGAWCKLDFMTWNPATESKTLGLIFNGSNMHFMLGVGHSGMNMNSNSMHVQAKCVVYIVGTSSQYVRGTYGGQVRAGWAYRDYFADLGAIYLNGSAAAHKILLTDNADQGLLIHVYALNDESNFDDVSQPLIQRQMIGVPFSSGNLFPMILPYQQNANLRIVAAGVS